MAIRAKIDSNETETAFAEEVIGTPGVLPVTPDWYPLEPNDFSDFGGKLTLLARRPINSSRQRKKGSITDLDASGGFNQDLTQANTQRLLQGFMYASYREKATAIFSAVTTTGYTVPDETIFKPGNLILAKGSAVSANNGLKLVVSVDAGSHEVRLAGLAADGAPTAGASITVVGCQAGAGDIDVTTSGNFATYTSTTLDFTTLGLIPGEFIYVGGDGALKSFAAPGNNGMKRVYSVAAHALVIDKSPLPMVTVADTANTVQFFFGRVLKNELADLIVRRSYNLERKLGVPDPSNPSQIQAEYVTGAFGNEATINIKQADKVNIDFTFIAMDNQQVVAATGPKTGTRHTIVEADAFNTSSDFNSMRLAIFNGTDEAPSPLFAHLLDLTINIKNNVSPNKAVAVLGAFDMTIGLFEVSFQANAYFSTVEAVAAIRANSNVTLHSFLAKNNSGMVIDLPLGALGDGRLDVKLDEAIMLPITMDAATAALLNPNTDYTLLVGFYDYLPSAAEIHG